MKIIMIGCDNPHCSRVGHPEDGGTASQPRPPYGWLTLKGGFFGSGPYFDIVVCSLDCAVPALCEATREEDR